MTPITDMPGLTEAVANLAQDQLCLNRAENSMQAEVEAIKTAFEAATRETRERIKDVVDAINVFCEKNKDLMFPERGGKRRKTFEVLEHLLQYRKSVTVQAAADAVDSIRAELVSLTEGDPEYKVLSRLLREAPPVLDKDAAKSLWEKHAALLTIHGVRLLEKETFKVVLQFSPEAAADQ